MTRDGWTAPRRGQPTPGQERSRGWDDAPPHAPGGWGGTEPGFPAGRPPPGDRDRGGPGPGAAGPDQPRRVPEPDRICGPAAVLALFARRPEAVLRLFHLPQRRAEAGPLCAAMARMRRPYREVGPDELARIAGTPHHGGLVAVAWPRPVPLLDPARPPPTGLLAAPVLPVLDGVGNPHNLGAVARSAAFLGCAALVVSSDPRQAAPSDSAHRTAEGGLEHLELWRAPDLPAALRAWGRHFLTVAAVAAGGGDPRALRDRAGDRRPVALVLGNEERGPTPAAIAACEARVTLAGRGPVESLNVSVAAALLIQALAPD